MNNSEIEQFAKDYLNSKNICFEAKNEKDQCFLFIKKLNNIFYIECHSSYYQRTLQPGDYGYPAQAGGFPCPSYKSCPSYRFVCDSNGNIIIDLAEIVNRPYDRPIRWIDEENIFLPIKIDNDNCDNWQHFRIQNGQAKLINTFEFCPDKNKNENLLKNKLLICDSKLYNFEKGIVLCDGFDRLLTSDENDLHSLANYWQIQSYNQRQEFLNIISKKMKDENLLVGYKKVQAQKDEFTMEYNVCVFVDKDGNFVSDLYYVDGYNFTSVDNVTPENFELVIQQLNDNLFSKIDAILSEREKKNTILNQVRKKLSL